MTNNMNVCPFIRRALYLLKRSLYTTTYMSTSGAVSPDASPRALPRPQIYTRRSPTAMGRWALSPSPSLWLGSSL